MRPALMLLWEESEHTCLSLSPIYMLMSSGPFTLRKLSWHSVATAFANRGLPSTCRSPPPSCLRVASLTAISYLACGGCNVEILLPGRLY